MGCGKSSVGRILSELLCCPFMDLDDVIETRCGRSITEIFAEDGEAWFRRMEKEALEDILRFREGGIPGQSLPHRHSKSSSFFSGEDARMVLALGGGAVIREECERMVHEGTFCVYLRTSVETLVERLTGEDSGRPLLSGAGPERPGNPTVMSSGVETSALRTRIMELMDQRAATYERVAS